LLKKAFEVYKEDGMRILFSRIVVYIKKEKIKLKESLRKKVSPFSKLDISSKYYFPDLKSEGTAAFTIVSKNYMHYALTLRNSFLKHNPNSRFTIFLVDMLESDDQISLFRKVSDLGIEIVNFLELNNGVSSNHKVDEMLLRYTILEMNTAIKPYAIEYLLRKGYEKVLYIDPDIMFYSSIENLDEKLNDNEIILTPHIQKPYFDTKSPSEIDIMMGGTYNLGFIAVRNTKGVFDMLKWWQDRLFDKGFSDVKNGMFTDQKWIELVPSLFDNVCIYKNPGYNVAYWNMHERQLKYDNGWVVNSEKLVFFHYSGMPLDNVYAISKHQNRYTLKDFPHLLPLFEEYRDVVRKYGPDEFAKCDYSFSKFSGGMVAFPDILRRKIYAEVSSFLISPFLACNNGKQKITNYIRQYLYGDLMVNRLASVIWDERIDLQQAFPDIKNSEASRISYNHWIINDGYKNYNVSKSLLPSLESIDDSIAASRGVNIVGYFESVNGVAEAARLYFKKSLSSSIATTLFSIPTAAHSQLTSEEILDYSRYYAESPAFSKNIFFVNSDEINNVKSHFPDLFKDKYNAAVWWWEFDDYFDFPDAFNCVDEVIVFTDFVARAIRKTAPENIKVTKMTYPFMKNWELTVSRSDIRKSIGISDADYMFLYVFDLFSGFDRKNPLALIDAFHTTSKTYSNARLVIKIGHTEHFADEYKSIQDRINKLSLKEKIIVLTESLPRNLYMSLMDGADAYISLHRSEGLGLSMLEAMYLGKPVIATSYGGNLEFMNEDNSLLVEHDIVELDRDFGPYKKGWLWAEPDILNASKHMIRLIFDSEFSDDLASKGQNDVMNQFDRTTHVNELYDFVSS
jgi:glycosyltransferase involved in cell wall biosynthesis/lipopolysaccharide biosynthesis glycosyltransferase